MAQIVCEAASAIAPLGLIELLRELGQGQNGFVGTSFGAGECTLEEYLQRVMQSDRVSVSSDGLVPQTTYWVLTPERVAVGMLRVRHSLNARLRDRGGHIGFFISEKYRGRGYAKAALVFALQRLCELGEPRALLTADSTNTPSIRVIQSCGGILDSEVVAEDTGMALQRYWIDLAART
jgi:predicted acetyltransferase